MFKCKNCRWLRYLRCNPTGGCFKIIVWLVVHYWFTVGIKETASWKMTPFFIADLPKTCLIHSRICMSYAWNDSHSGEISQKHGRTVGSTTQPSSYLPRIFQIFEICPKLYYFIHEYACFRLDILPSAAPRSYFSTVVLTIAIDILQVKRSFVFLANFSEMVDLSGIRYAYSWMNLKIWNKKGIIF